MANFSSLDDATVSKLMDCMDFDAAHMFALTCKRFAQFDPAPAAIARNSLVYAVRLGSARLVRRLMGSAVDTYPATICASFRRRLDLVTSMTPVGMMLASPVAFAMVSIVGTTEEFLEFAMSNCEHIGFAQLAFEAARKFKKGIQPTEILGTPSYGITMLVAYFAGDYDYVRANCRDDTANIIATWDPRFTDIANENVDLRCAAIAHNEALFMLAAKNGWTDSLPIATDYSVNSRDVVGAELALKYGAGLVPLLVAKCDNRREFDAILATIEEIASVPCKLPRDFEFTRSRSLILGTRCQHIRLNQCSANAVGGSQFCAKHRGYVNVELWYEPAQAARGPGRIRMRVARNAARRELGSARRELVYSIGLKKMRVKAHIATGRLIGKSGPPGGIITFVIENFAMRMM